MPTEKHTLRIVDLGFAPYEATLALQRETRERRLEQRAPDTLFLVEHPHTITLGRRTEPSELLAPPAFFEAQGVPLVTVERGGKATYHGPGQVVAYPVVSLRDLGRDVPDYVRGLEQVMIDYLATLGMEGQRRHGLPGVWVWGRKIGAIGVHLKRWVTIHGFALNLNPDLFQFSNIVPCGIADSEVTSVARELHRSPWVSEAKTTIAELFTRQFGFEAARVESLPQHK